jgi:hypothetical protein
MGQTWQIRSNCGENPQELEIAARLRRGFFERQRRPVTNLFAVPGIDAIPCINLCHFIALIVEDA